MYSCRIWQSFRKCESHKSCVDENVRKVCCSSRKAALTSFALSSIIGLSTFQINQTWIDFPDISTLCSKGKFPGGYHDVTIESLAVTTEVGSRRKSQSGL